MVKQYSNELELVEVINLHVDDLSEEDGNFTNQFKFKSFEAYFGIIIK